MFTLPGNWSVLTEAPPGCGRPPLQLSLCQGPGLRSLYEANFSSSLPYSSLSVEVRQQDLSLLPHKAASNRPRASAQNKKTAENPTVATQSRRHGDPRGWDLSCILRPRLPRDQAQGGRGQSWAPPRSKAARRQRRRRLAAPWSGAENPNPHPQPAPTTVEPRGCWRGWRPQASVSTRPLGSPAPVSFVSGDPKAQDPHPAESL